MKLQRIGLELRKIGSVNSLYDDVDAVLENYNIKHQSTSPSVQVQTVAHSLQKMIKYSSYFSVCTIERCAKVACIFVPKERMDVYQAAHCINWNEMTDEYRTMLTAMVLDDFRSVLNPIQ